MNIYAALQHAFIGYGIKRSDWRNNPNSPLFNDTLYWHTDAQNLSMLKNDMEYTLTPEDWAATDWEAV